MARRQAAPTPAQVRVKTKVLIEILKLYILAKARQDEAGADELQNIMIGIMETTGIDSDDRWNSHQITDGQFLAELENELAKTEAPTQ